MSFDVELSKTLSRALRHEPWRYELELDDNGWVEIDQVLDGLRDRRSRWASLGRSDLEAIIAGSAKVRHEIDGSRIRAI